MKQQKLSIFLILTVTKLSCEGCSSDGKKSLYLIEEEDRTWVERVNKLGKDLFNKANLAHQRQFEDQLFDNKSNVEGLKYLYWLVKAGCPTRAITSTSKSVPASTNEKQNTDVYEIDNSNMTYTPNKQPDHSGNISQYQFVPKLLLCTSTKYIINKLYLD